MAKRSSDAVEVNDSKSAANGQATARAPAPDEEMGEFEDKWEDEVESEAEADDPDAVEDRQHFLYDSFEKPFAHAKQNSHPLMRTKINHLVRNRPTSRVSSLDPTNSSSPIIQSTSLSTPSPTHGHVSPSMSSEIVSV